VSRRRHHRLSTPLALLAGFALCLALVHLAAVVLVGGALVGGGLVLAARAARPRRAATRRPRRDIPAVVTVKPEPPAGSCGHGDAPPPEPPRPVKPADRPLTQISPDDPDAAEAVRRALRGRAAGRSERIDPPAPSPDGQR
jgi:hypothetical protein